MEELLDAVFSMRSVPRLYSENRPGNFVSLVNFRAHTDPRLSHGFPSIVRYIYDYTMKLFRQQAEVIQNHENSNVRDIGK
jgi:hypothetical protein